MFDIGTLVLLDMRNGRRLGSFPPNGGVVFCGRSAACQIELRDARHRVCGAFVPLRSGWELVNNPVYSGNMKGALVLRAQDDRVRVELGSGAHVALPGRVGRVSIPSRGADVDLLWRLDGFVPPPLVPQIDQLTARLLGTPQAGADDSTPATSLTAKEVETLVALCSEVLAGRSRRLLPWPEVAALVGDDTTGDKHRKRMTHLVGKWRAANEVPPDADLYDVAERILNSGRLQQFFERGTWRIGDRRGDGAG